jgi:hypothetical protein
MNCEKCSKYKFGTYLQVSFIAFSEDFEIVEEESGQSHCSGTCSCKSCGISFGFQYENLIHEKLIMEVKTK